MYFSKIWLHFSAANELMFLNPTTHFHINVSWEWTYGGYHEGHTTKINQNMCGIMYYAMLYSMSGRQKVLGFYSQLYTASLAHMWLLNYLSSFVKNVIIVKNNTSAIGKTCPSVVLYCFLKYLRECQFFKEIVIFQKSDPFFVLFQTARTLLISTLHWEAMLFWKCLYPYFNFKWLFDVATEVKILLWHTYRKIPFRLGDAHMISPRVFKHSMQLTHLCVNESTTFY